MAEEMAVRHLEQMFFPFGWVALAVMAAPAPATACASYARPELTDVSLADAVVIGRVENYRIVRDEAYRRDKLASPRLTEDMRKLYENPSGGLLSDYARFEVQVEKVLAGRAPPRLSVTWDNSTFLEPAEMKPGRYLLAMRWPKSATPPLRGPSATISPSPDPTVMTLLQAPCSRAFIYEADSAGARIIRFILSPAARAVPGMLGERGLYGGRGQELITADDYPADALRTRAEGLTAVAMTIGVDGRPLDCAVIASSGAASLDAATCALLKRRYRKTPAIGSNGRPATERVRMTHMWVIPTSREDVDGL